MGLSSESALGRRVIVSLMTDPSFVLVSLYDESGAKTRVVVAPGLATLCHCGLPIEPRAVDSERSIIILSKP